MVGVEAIANGCLFWIAVIRQALSDATDPAPSPRSVPVRLELDRLIPGSKVSSTMRTFSGPSSADDAEPT